MKLDDYSKYYIQGSDHYLISKDEFIELFNEMEAWKDQSKKIEMIRLDQTKKVFDTIANIIKDGSCSYRHLIYDELEFYDVNYEELLSGMTITNAICDLEDLKEQREEDLKEIEKLTSIWKIKSEENKKLKEEIKAVNKGLRKVRERALKCKYKSLDLQKENQELKEFVSSLLNNNGYKFKNGNGKIVFGLDNDVKRLEREIEELTKQLEEKEDYINKLQASKNKLNKWNYENTVKQKVVIKYLEEKINYYKINTQCFSMNLIKEILQKYKEIIGDDK